MPIFEKSTGYKMKGSKFYGKGNQSPLKASDEQVIAAQDKLDHIELDWKLPGWAKAAGDVSALDDETSDVAGPKEVKPVPKKNVQENAQKNLLPSVNTPELKVNEDLMKESPKLKTGSMGAGGLGGQ